MLREGCSDEEIQAAIQEVIVHKPQGHHFQEKRAAEEARLMAQIGG
jgi:molybdenum cofactor biosynthesis enzyme MoaA